MTTVLIARAEFRVNSITLSDQRAPAIATLADGSYVVAWQSFQTLPPSGLYPDDYDIHVQRFAADGTALGAEKALVPIALNQVQPTVTALPDGGYVVAYASLQDYDGRYKRFDYGVFSMRLDAQDQVVDGASWSNGLLGDQDRPSLATLADGSAKLVYTTAGSAEIGMPAGVVGGGFPGADGVVAGLANGGYVAAWAAAGEVVLQRFDASHAAIGGPVQVNTTMANAQSRPAVVSLADGGYAVAWESAGQDGSGLGVFMQRYDAAGIAVGAETRVNSTTANDQGAPSLVALGDGGYAVAWVSAGQDGSGGGIYFQRYDSGGRTVGAETLVNSTTAGDQADPALAATADGGFIVTWESQGQDGSGWGIYAKEFDAVAAGHIVTGLALDVHGHDGMAYRLYQAALNRTPDLSGLNYHTQALDDGLAISQVAQHFIDSPEFAGIYGNVGTEQFVSLLYQNVLHRAPDAEGLAYHVNALNTDHARADVLVGFSESPENQAALVGVIQGGIVYA